MNFIYSTVQYCRKSPMHYLTLLALAKCMVARSSFQGQSHTLAKSALSNTSLTGCVVDGDPLVPGDFFFEFVDESSYRGALWKQIRKSKISGQCLHPLPRYGNFLFFGFFNNATLFSNQLFSNFTCLKLRTRQTQNRWNFCNISTRS